MANLRYCDSFKSCLLKHECKSGKLDGDKMGHISKIGLPGSCCCQPEKFQDYYLFLFCFRTKIFFGWRQDGAHIQDWPGSCCCQPEERNILGLRLIIFQKTFSATCKYTDIYSGCGHVCWSKHQESLWVWCGAGIDQEYCEAYSQHAIYSFAKVTAITSIDEVRILLLGYTFVFRYQVFASSSLYNVAMCLRVVPTSIVFV